MLAIKFTVCAAAVLFGLIGPVYQASIAAASADGSGGSAVQQIVPNKETKRIPIGQWSSRKRSGQLSYFKEWSPWGSCDADCRQRRERVCRVLRKCADSKYVEERRCSICEEQPQSMGGHHHRDMSASHQYALESSSSLDRSAADGAVSKFDVNKFNPKLRRDVDQMDDSQFHIIKINPKKIIRQPEIQGNKSEFARPVLALQVINDGNASAIQESDGSKAVSSNSIFGDYSDNFTDIDYQADDAFGEGRPRWKSGQTIKKYAPIVTAVDPKAAFRVYSRWSKWSKCSAKCTTRRFKRCRMKEVCGNEVLREVAYCYTEGSFCEDWIVRQMYSNVPRSPGQLTVEQTAISRNANSIQERKMLTRATGITPAAGQCGIATAIGSKRRPASHMLRIIGGRVVRRGSYPWQVAILNRFKEAFCGGTLISKQWILTAAHCVRKRLYVRLGEHNLEEKDGTEVEYRVEYAIRNPHYDKTTVDNDIALLRLPKEIIPSAYIGFACLPEKYQKLPVGTKCTIIGWGKRKNLDDAGTKYLHEAQVPIVPNEECKEVYDDYTITKNMFCAGHKRGRIDTCSGDSGGPLLCKDPNTAHWSILGVTSFGDGCGKRNKFGIYTKVSNYVDWIQSVIECSGNCRSF